MGLDAVVYLHKDNLPLTVKNDCPNTDIETGEVYFEDLELVKKYPKRMFTAIYRNLGNIAMIEALRSEVSKVLGVDSILYENVLYNGSHSGDIIGLSDMETLESEIKLLGLSTNVSDSLKVFLESLSELVNAAKIQKNPIVFV